MANVVYVGEILQTRLDPVVGWYLAMGPVIVSRSKKEVRDALVQHQRDKVMYRIDRDAPEYMARTKVAREDWDKDWE